MYTTEYQFDAKGSVVCTRRWRRQGVVNTAIFRRSADDHVVKLGLGTTAGRDLGLPVIEFVAGGGGRRPSDGIPLRHRRW